MHWGKGVSAGVAVFGIFLLTIGLAFCFMPVYEIRTVYELTTYPNREVGYFLSAAGVVIGTLGFIGFFSSEDRQRKEV